MTLTLLMTLVFVKQINASQITRCYHGDLQNPFEELYAVVSNGICPVYVHPEPTNNKMHRVGDPDCQLNSVNPFE